MLEEYIHYFETEQEYNDYVNSSAYTEPFVSTYLTNSSLTVVNYNLGELAQPLTFEIVSGGTLYWRCSNTALTKTIEYKKNDGEWTSITSSQDNDGSGTTIATVVAGDIVKFRGNNTTYATNFEIYNYFVNTQNCCYYVYGNIMSLVNSSNFVTNKTLSNQYTFCSIFVGCSGLLVSNKQLLLPATTLSNNCYSYMFSGCTSLTTAPALPATTLEYSCYYNMFGSCTSLATAPALPATTLANSCYRYMFQGCTSLTTAPALPATALTEYCYNSMFQNCTSLTTAPELPASALTSRCYQNMFYNCTSLTTAPALPATALTEYCYNSMFQGCISLTTAPELPATTLVNSCYSSMFAGCTSLTTAPELPATTLVNSCYNGMFYGCSKLTSAPELPATTLIDFCYYRMFWGCTKLNYIKCLATDISANNCISAWVNEVQTNLGTFIKDANMVVGSGGWSRGIHGIPNNWTVEDAS